MLNKMIINLPVKDFDSSRSFFSKVGFDIDTDLSDENALCCTINPGVTIAMLPNDHFAEATKSDLTDTSQTHEVLLSVEKESEQDVDSLVESAIQLGAKEVHDPIRIEDLYGRSFADLDGHQWNIFCKLQ